MSLLTIKNLSLTFPGVEAVKKISLTIEKGEMLALVGESGSGKSLTALSCLGLQPPSAAVSGSIVLDGIEAIGAPREILKTLRGKRAGIVFQEPMTALNPLHTIGKQISEMWRDGDMEMWRKTDPHIPTSPHHRIHSLLDQVGLSYMKDRLDAFPHQLSGGERQRVMIAMAIANKPALLIADEPTTAVDVTIQVKILKLIQDLQKEMGMAVLFITHDLTVVRKLADRVAIMQYGEIVEQGKVSEIFAAPKHAYTQKLLGSEPKGEAVPLPSARETVIACENLKAWFPIKRGLLQRTSGYIKAVDDVTVSIEKGATLGVVGESGSGKTTLGFSLLRLIKSEGKIVYMGSGIDRLQTKALRPFRKEMQVVFQDPYSSLNPRMSVAQIIEEGLFVHYPEISEKARTVMVNDILVEMGLSPDIRNRFPHEFSGGQRQRISIARAMVLKPKLVVLDEPTSALDLTVQKQIIDLLKNLQSKYGLSYMFISHDLRTIKAIAHTIVVMHKGKVVEMAATPALFANPKSDYTRALINAAFLKD
jgi:microcin C transport system ATP-binding protein